MFVFLGLLLGTAEFLLLRQITTLILANKKSFIALIIIKIALYASSIAVMWFFFKDKFLYAGIGLGAGLVVGAFINYIYTNFIKKKPEEGEGGT